MAKLDPDNFKSAKDVMDEREAAYLKRKRQEDGEEDDSSHKSDEIVELSKQTSNKKRKTNNGLAEKAEPAPLTEQERRRQKADKKKEKRERKNTQKAKAKEKKDRAKARKTEIETENQESEDGEPAGEADMPDIVEEKADESTAPSSPEPVNTLLSPHIHSASSSISSIQPTAVEDASKQPQDTPLTEAVHKENQDRFHARMAELRAQRKANDKPVRSRQDLLDQRRKKEQLKKEQKKEQRRKEQEEEIRRQDEEMAKRFSPGGSGSILASPRSPMADDSFSFGRIAFADGSASDAHLTGLLDQHKRKGPSDTKGALHAAQNKKARISGLDDEKRAKIESQEMWLSANKKAHGERVRDDTSLLKKALKRNEKTKEKSSKEWDGRIEGVAKGQAARQHKRDENLQKRRDDKGKKGKKTKSKPKVKRPGFEGSFKGRTGGGKKKK